MKLEKEFFFFTIFREREKHCSLLSLSLSFLSLLSNSKLAPSSSSPPPRLRRQVALPSPPVHVPRHAPSQLLLADLLAAGAPRQRRRVRRRGDRPEQGVGVAVRRESLLGRGDVDAADEVVAAVGREAVLGEGGREVEGAAGRWRGRLGRAAEREEKKGEKDDDDDDEVEVETGSSSHCFFLFRFGKCRASLFLFLFSFSLKKKEIRMIAVGRKSNSAET